MKRKVILRQIDAKGCDVHGTSPSVDACGDESSHFPSRPLVADTRDRTAHSGWGSPFHSLAVMRSAMRIVMVLGAASIVGACQVGPTRVGDVRIAPIEPPDALHLELESDEIFIVGAPFADDRRMPRYPTNLLAHRLPPVHLCAELETDTSGKVVASRAIAAPGCNSPSGEHQAAFASAVSDAVLTWRYEPSYICSSAGTTSIQGGCGSEHAEAIPLLRAYRFVFSQRAGKPTVQVTDAVGP